MTYYCFLCNEDHEGIPTKEHFIPKSMGVPKSQWLPVCEASNARSNSIFDKHSKNILYHTSRQSLMRTGEALLKDGHSHIFIEQVGRLTAFCSGIFARMSFGDAKLSREPCHNLSSRGISNEDFESKKLARRTIYPRRTQNFTPMNVGLVLSQSGEEGIQTLGARKSSII